MPEHKSSIQGNGMSRGSFLRSLALLVAGVGAGAGPLHRIIGLPRARPVRPTAPPRSVKRHG